MDCSEARRIVVKLGTKVVTGDFGNIERTRLKPIVRDIAELKRSGVEVLVVSSGAVGLGRKVLDNTERGELSFRQACASIGQNLLMTEYQKLFAAHGVTVAQVLITAADLADRTRYLNLRSMLHELLELGVVPIINENDSVSTMELEEHGREKVFGDNDKLSALIASKTESDLLVLLTDVDGVYDKNPKEHNEAKRIDEISDIDDIREIHVGEGTEEGRGGLSSKLKAVRLASMSGVPSIIASGMYEDIISHIFSDQPRNFGTLILPTGKVSARRKWIGFSSGVEGAITVNLGAQVALEGSSASLLPVGIVAVSGPFSAGTVVSIESDGIELGRGIVNYSSEDVQKLIGRKSSEVQEVLGQTGPEEIVHRDRLIIFNEKVS